jgi:hypothetical protein
MNSISIDIVESTWKKAKDITDDEMAGLISKLSDDQPLLMAYLISVGEQLLDDEEQELLFFYGLLIWDMMSQGKTPLPEMTENGLADAERANADLVAFIEDGPDAVFKNEFQRILETYNQPDLLNFVVEVVTEGLQDEDIRPQSYGPMILYLKVTIDGLDNAQPLGTTS